MLRLNLNGGKFTVRKGNNVLKINDLKFDVNDLKSVFRRIVKDEFVLKVITEEYLGCLRLGMDRLEAFNEVADKWIDGDFGDSVNGEIKPVITSIDLAVDKMFQDDWRVLEAGMDEYVWGWDGGGWVSYE